jgi:hypothetical protein
MYYTNGCTIRLYNMRTAAFVRTGFLAATSSLCHHSALRPSRLAMSEATTEVRWATRGTYLEVSLRRTITIVNRSERSVDCVFSLSVSLLL